MHRFAGILPRWIWTCWHGIIKICLFSCQFVFSEVSWLKCTWIQIALHPYGGFYYKHSHLFTCIPKIFTSGTSVSLWGKHLLEGMNWIKPGHICLPCYGLSSLTLFMNKSYRMDKLVTTTACFIRASKHKFMHLQLFPCRNWKIIMF